ncbi:hypothetical protein DVA67_033290 [Solirubrobacter sp. CPCC 204708]|uniref:Zinc ribbon domain-containing protein n=1 Tax=Solirubrobacter deserti TaxID=2282478 RepID=A0ABT4RJ48_9ACTN|nr:hypothetical protein [Solirubrobacter deserti]MBE2320881.1 hypothetical protein [Solirubrobacter deserti]MDA0138515.1 hypothetical protein [Solirubrobacter deserti]
MEGSVGAPPQRVCPKCARISWATGPQCPYCTANFRRSGGVAPWMLVVTALVVLAGVGLMFYITVQEVDDRVNSVRGEIDRNFQQLQTDVRRELDARIPAGGVGAVPTPTVTPLPTETPTPAPTTEGELPPEPTIEGETTPDASVTPTPTEPEIIEP